MIRSTATQQPDLVHAVDSLRDEVRVLRQVLDEIREALQWQNNNAEDYPALVENRGMPHSLANATLPPPPSSAESSQSFPAAESIAYTTQQKLF